MKRAVFMDRDGVINKDTGYPHKLDELVIPPYVPEFLSWAKKQGFELIVVSNQSGIGRGYFTREDVDAFNSNLCDQLDGLLEPSDFYYCPHIDEDYCVCRKPKPGLLHKAIIERDLDHHESILIGDKMTDMEVGSKTGISNKVIIRPKAKKVKYNRGPSSSYFTARNLQETAGLIARWASDWGVTRGGWDWSVKENQKTCSCRVTYRWTNSHHKHAGERCLCEDDHTLDPDGDPIF